AQLALATLSGIAHLTGSEAAKAAYEALMADGAPFSSAEAFSGDPTFALAAPGSNNVAPTTPSVSTPVAPAPVDTPADTSDDVSGDTGSNAGSGNAGGEVVAGDPPVDVTTPEVT